MPTHLASLHTCARCIIILDTFLRELGVTPAMQAGLTKKPMSIEDIANLALVEAPKKRGVYKKKQ